VYDISLKSMNYKLN